MFALLVAAAPLTSFSRRAKLQYDIDQKNETIQLDAQVLGMDAGGHVPKCHNKSSVLPYAWSGTSAELMSFAQDVCATAQRLVAKSANIRAARAGIEEEGRRRSRVHPCRIIVS